MSASHSENRRRIACCLLVAVVVTPDVITAASGTQPRYDRANLPAEEIRLGTADFRAGLKKRGLSDVLSLHLQEFPPTNENELHIMTRDLRLAESRDATRTYEDRQAALAEANRLLALLIEANPDDSRQFDWSFSLARSLIYDEADPFITNILYRGGTNDDRKNTLARTGPAVTALKKLVHELRSESVRVDQLSVREFEKLERSGHIEQIDKLLPRSEYLLLWALLYDSIPRDAKNSTRVRQLHEINTRLTANPALLTATHKVSHVQVQALLLAGMTQRNLNRFRKAQEQLNRAIQVASKIDDAPEFARIEWAVRLAWIELVRNGRDAQRFATALTYLTRMRAALTVDDPSHIGLNIVAALLERSIYLARAKKTAQSGGNPAEDKKRAWQALAVIVTQSPDIRDELYSVLYGQMDSDVTPTGLDPIERSAAVAGLLFDAGQYPDRADAYLDRAITMGDSFLADYSAIARSLVPEVLFNRSVAQYRRGQLAAAADGFLTVARDHDHFSDALRAARFAVQLGAELHGARELADDPRVQTLYRESLRVIVSQYERSDAARFWRFYYAQLLEDAEEYELAAVQYERVATDHEHHIEGVFSRVRCLAVLLARASADVGSDPLDLQKRTSEFFTDQRGFVALATAALAREPAGQRADTWRMLLARSRIMTAEVQASRHVDRSTQALDTLADFETSFGMHRELLGRVWRVRLLAYEQLGQLDRAARAIPAYMAADPVDAGQTLQSLYLALTTDIAQARRSDDETTAQRKAEMALMLAERIHEWAQRTGRGDVLGDRRMSTIQLAEAHLRAKSYEQARDVLEPLVAMVDRATTLGDDLDLRVLLGYAESLFQLGEYAEALPRFNRLATKLPATNQTHWQSLLRDLQCRTELHHPPQGIIQVVQQQKHLYPDLGGPQFLQSFEKLRRDNERRADTKP